MQDAQIDAMARVIDASDVGWAQDPSLIVEFTRHDPYSKMRLPVPEKLLDTVIGQKSPRTECHGCGLLASTMTIIASASSPMSVHHSRGSCVFSSGFLSKPSSRISAHQGKSRRPAGRTDKQVNGGGGKTGMVIGLLSTAVGVAGAVYYIKMMQDS